MLTFFSSIWWLIVALGVLVTLHELGHFLTARYFGVKVEKFSVGFGRAILARRGRDGVQYCLGWIPLGGYVKMLDERDCAPATPEAERRRAFNRQSVGVRFAVVLAGPLVNLVLAIVLFWLMFTLGIQSMRPLVGDTEGLAAASGLQRGEEIVQVDGQDVTSWQSTVLSLVTPAMARRDVALTVRQGESGEPLRRELALSKLGNDFDETKLLSEVGLVPLRPVVPARVSSVNDGSPAAAAGLQADDEIIAIDGQALADGLNWQSYIQARPGETLRLQVQRAGERFETTVTPELETLDGREVGLIGIGVAALSESERESLLNRFYVTERFGPLESLQRSVAESWRMSALTVDVLRRMIMGEASYKNLSGPISIANYARQHAELGLERFLQFLGFLSLSLFILNLLPIPVLDGGHLLYYLIEAVRGKPVSEQAQMTGQMLGMLLMGALMILIVFVDLQRLFGQG